MHDRDLFGAIRGVIEESDPGKGARTATAFLARLCRCSTAGTWAEEGGALRLLASHQLDQAAIDAVSQAWPGSRQRLRRGERLATSQGLIVPLRAEDEFVGVLYLRPDIPNDLDLRRCAALLELLGKLARLSPAPEDAWRTTIRNVDPLEIEREQLVYLLEKSEWNIARAARAKGVTRPTIYSWMRRLGVKRGFERNSLESL
jgi:transcriptional regulator with GAF, ATPase, and Fis domain